MELLYAVAAEFSESFLIVAAVVLVAVAVTLGTLSAIWSARFTDDAWVLART